MEYDEFCALLFIALEIFEKIEEGCHRQISKSLQSAELSEQIETFKQKSQQRQESLRKVDSFRHGTMDSLDLMTKKELNQRGDLDVILESMEEMAPTLAAQFDQDGDEKFSFEEFRAFLTHLRKEYEF